MNQDFMRILAALVTALIAALAATPLVRAMAIRIGAIDVPKDARRMHKKPIPLIGGLAIFFGFSLSAGIFYSIFFGLDRQAITVWFGGLFIVALGVIDDMIALNPWVKLAGQFVGAGIAVSQHFVIDYVNIGGFEVDFGIAAYPITVLWIVIMTNAVNLIDGLDGLACGVSVISSVSLLIIAMLRSDTQTALLTAALCGACLGFLPYNANPAKIFMGDTGSFVLGGAVAALAIVTKTELFLPILGAVYVAEVLSDIIQVSVYKKTKKRVFRMAQLHHHFELGGWKEQKVVYTFWTAAVIAVVVGLILYMLTDVGAMLMLRGVWNG